MLIMKMKKNRCYCKRQNQKELALKSYSKIKDKEVVSNSSVLDL